MNRTGSIGSWVGPAVTRRRRPARSRPRPSTSSTRARIHSRSHIRPDPSSPAASVPPNRPTDSTPPPSSSPVTPSSTRRPERLDLLDADTLGPLEDDLALGDLLQRDRQRLVLQAARLDERRHELPAALAELRVVGVDLAGPLRREDHQGVLRVHPLGTEQVVDLRFDHALSPSGVR